MLKNKRKNLLVIAMIITLVLGSVSTAFAGFDNNTIGTSRPAGVYVDGVKLVESESAGMFWIDSSARTQAPLRLLGEALGCQVGWDGANYVASLTKGDTVIKVPIGQKYILVNDVKTEMDTVAGVIKGRTYIPLRAVSEALGLTVGTAPSGSMFNVLITSGSQTAQSGEFVGVKPMEAGYSKWDNIETDLPNFYAEAEKSGMEHSKESNGDYSVYGGQGYYMAVQLESGYMEIKSYINVAHPETSDKMYPIFKALMQDTLDPASYTAVMEYLDWFNAECVKRVGTPEVGNFIRQEATKNPILGNVKLGWYDMGDTLVFWNIRQ